MKKTNHAAIGAFVIGAIALLVFAIMLFGSGGVFETNIPYTLSFDKSVKGLSKGAPVMFRGIKIGEVTDIKLSFDNNDTVSHETSGLIVSWPITVTINLFPYSVAFAENRNVSWYERMLRKFHPQKARETMEKWLQDMILKKGLRGQLQSQNLLTGMLYIELDLFFREKATPETRRLVEQHIIPTRMSAIERLYLSLNQSNFTTQINHLFSIMDSLGNLFQEGKFERLLDNITSASQKIDTTLTDVNIIIRDLQQQKPRKIMKTISAIAASMERSALEIEGILKKLNGTQTDDILRKTSDAVTTLQQTLKELKTNMPGLFDSAKHSLNAVSQAADTLAPKLDATLTNAHDLVETLKETAKDTKQPMTEALKNLNQTLENMNRATAEAGLLMQDARKAMQPNSPVITNLNQAIRDAQQAARSVKALTDMLSDYPESLLRGSPEH